MEISDIRRRFRSAIEKARLASAERRARTDAAAADYDLFLRSTAVPVVRMVASVAKAEGHPFTVFTPAGTVRLASERGADDAIEIYLDPSADPPQVTARVSRRRGGDLLITERPVREGTQVNALTDEDVLAFLLTEVAAMSER